MKRGIAVILAISFSMISKAQTTIGSDEKPNKGALLDLKMNSNSSVNSTKGLGLPRVELKNIRTEKDLGKTMGMSEENKLIHADHIGMIVYNTGINIQTEETRFCPGIHVWNGEQWQPLTPYPEIKIKKGDYLSYKRSFEYLDPANPKGWPIDKEKSRANGYYQLGRNVPADNSLSPNGTDNISDQRPGETSANTYTVSRFYVGYKIIAQTYKIKKSLSCNTAEEIDWNTISELPDILTDTTKIFDEGVWMTQNLRTTRFQDGTEITRRTPENYGESSTSIPQYTVPGIVAISPNPSIEENGGALYNWAAAVGVGRKNGLPTFPSTNLKKDEGNDAHPDVMYQGICPSGWYLPSNQEWTDLANGVTRIVSSSSSTLFADQLSGAATSIQYGENLPSSANSGIGGYLGQALKTKQAVGSYPGSGKSKARNSSGFDAYLIGSSALASNGNIAHYLYGEATYFWSSSINPYFSTSSPNRIYVYHTSLQNLANVNPNNFYQGYHNTFQTFSVRCKKVTK